MQNKIKFLMAASILVPVFAVSTVFAIEGSSNMTTTTTPVARETETDNLSTTKPEDVTNPEELRLRLEKRKSEMKTKLTNIEQARIKLKCKGSQGNLKSLDGRIKGIETSREKVYGNLGDRLTKLSAKLKERGLDTTTLDSQIVALKVKTDAFKVELATYKQAVSDLATMDCVAQPTEYKASLEAARTLREKLTVSGKAIKTYVNDTIKPTIKTLRSQIEKTEKTEGSNE